MNQNEYLQELMFGLEKNLPESEIQDILDEYQGFFIDGLAEGRTEEEISTSLGSPARLVSTLTEDKEKTDYNSKPHNSDVNISQATSGVINKKISLPLATLGQRIGAKMLDRLFIIIFVIIILFAVGRFSSSFNKNNNASSSSASSYNNIIQYNNENNINNTTTTAPATGAVTSTSTLLLVIVLATFLIPSEFIGMIIFFQFFSTIIFKQAHDATGNPPSSSLIFIYFLIFMLFSFYKPIMESIWNGRTIGKRLLGIRVASEDGSRAGVGKVLIRELIGDGLIGTLTASLTTIISIFTVAIGLPRKSIPDYIASTIVIIDKSQTNNAAKNEGLNL
ncbi:MAG: RDD family protein [Saccharofermentanales bacterium]